MNKHAIQFLFAVSLLLGAGIANAQFGAELESVGPDFTIETSSSVPAPNTTFRVTIVSFSTDLNRADITWRVNGAVVARGVGKLFYDVTVGKVGSATTLTVTAQTREGTTITQGRIFKPGFVELLWEADSWTPPFYKGKALLTAKAAITAQAIPYLFDGKLKIPAENLYYNWYYDFDPLPEATGVGKDTIVVEAPDLFGAKNLRVKVSSLDNQISADSQITLRPSNPLVMVWRNDPLKGLDYDHPVGASISFEEEEVSFEAAGLYFPKSHVKSPGLSFKWALNGKPAVVDDEKPETLTIKRTEGGGEGRISIDIQDPFDRIISSSKAFFIKATTKTF